MPEFLDAKTVFTIIHLLGVALGLGGAFTSDALFFKSVKDKLISKTEFEFMRLGGKIVWIGLFVLAFSGVVLFSLNPEHYLESGKFQAKMTIVVIIALNGLVFHHIHLPRMRKFLGKNLMESKEFMQKSSLLMASGSLSTVSWLSALVLGSMRAIPYPYLSIMAVYAAAILGALIISLFSKRIFLKTR